MDDLLFDAPEGVKAFFGQDGAMAWLRKLISAEVSAQLATRDEAVREELRRAKVI